MNTQQRLSNLKSTNIKGKPYVMVDQRLSHLARYSNYDVKIKKVKYYNDIKTWVVQIVLAIQWNDNEFFNTYEGVAQEVIGEGMINKTSALENCYTSALGKACASAGIGLQHGTASGDEILKAQANSDRIDAGFNSILERLDDWKKKYPEWTTFINKAQNEYRLSNDQVDQLSKLWAIKKAS